MRILGIETSCDETAASVVDGKHGGISILSNVVSSQIEIHKKYGGVVPEVAAREHVLNILPVVNEALVKAGMGGPSQPPPRSLRRRGREGMLDAIAVTIGPGLITSLIAGTETAKVLSFVWDIPVIGVNHIEGHIYANFINRQEEIKFPALALTVSGGHTMLILMRGQGKYKVIGETVDDAAGEAFDKAAAMMGIGYPGGPIISKYADDHLKNNFQFSISKQFSILNDQKLKNKSQIPNPKSQISLPRPMMNSKDYNFSFSGLKTALLYQIQKDKEWNKKIPNYCAEFQQAVIDVLIHKTIKAAEKYKVKTIMLSGGVAANKELRAQMAEAAKDLSGVKFIMPDLKYTTDNAAMIAAAGYYKALRKKFTPWQKLKVNCNEEL